MPGLIQETKNVLKKIGVIPSRRLSQNFMVDDSALSFIADALFPKPGETVVEIGPGLGFLTRQLLERKVQVLAVEKDRRIASYLRKHFTDQLLRVVESDILQVNLNTDFGFKDRVKIAGNIPYGITSPILEWLISQRDWLSRAVLTVQWEVALRLTARPGTKSWGPLSLFVQVYAKVSLLKKISSNSFFPSPKVNSAVIALDFSAEPLFSIPDEAKFFALSRRAFQKRRKTLLNSLKEKELGHPYSKEALLAVFWRAGIDPERRPETLSISEWIALSGSF